MDTISDLIYKGINIKKENNFAFSKIKKFCNSFTLKTSNIKKFNTEVDSIRRENKYNITFINHLKTVIFEKLKTLKSNNESFKNSEKEKIKKIKNNFLSLAELFEKINSHRENLSLILNDMPKPEVLESILIKEINYLKDIVYESTFSNFKSYKNECLEFFDKVNSCKMLETEEGFPKEYLEYSDEFINDHKEYLANIENQYIVIGDLLKNLIPTILNEINLYKNLFVEINEFMAILNDSESKAKIFRKQKGLINNLNVGNISHYKKLFEDFKENLSNIINTEEKNISLANQATIKLKTIRTLINGFGVKSIKNKFMFLEDHLTILNDKAREINIEIS